MTIKKTVFSIIKILKRILKIPIVISRYGFVHSLRLFYISYVLPVRVKMAPISLKFYRKINSIKSQNYSLNKELKYWEKKKEEILKRGKDGYKIRIDELGLNQEKLQLLKNTQQQSHEVVIAEIDQDGFILSHFGPIKDLPTISKEQYVMRKRFTLQIVAINGNIGVKKNYNGDRVSFLNELRALHSLGVAGCNVPAIMDIDFNNLILAFSYILGDILREKLAKKGAVLRDRDVDNNPDFIALNKQTKRLKRIEQGQRFLYQVINRDFINNLFIQLKKVHAKGFIWNDIKYGNIIIEKKSGNPYIIDFDYMHYHPKLGKHAFRILQDEDIEKFNLHFNTNKQTFKRMVEKIKIINENNIYAPVYFDAGLKMGNIFNNDSGYGRWHYILKKHLPVLKEKRILDLGANNAFTSIQMLRNGAKEVIGIEIDNKYISQGNFLKAGFEYIDNKLYNFQYIQTSIENITKLNLGKFDLVLALCSIYYLNDDLIKKVSKYISTITDTFVLQCNTATNIKRSNPHTYEKASIHYAINVLRNNGFPVIKVIKPFKYTRPLIIGKKDS